MLPVNAGKKQSSQDTMLVCWIQRARSNGSTRERSNAENFENFENRREKKRSKCWKISNSEKTGNKKKRQKAIRSPEVSVRQSPLCRYFPSEALAVVQKYDPPNLFIVHQQVIESKAQRWAAMSTTYKCVIERLNIWSRRAPDVQSDEYFCRDYRIANFQSNKTTPS